MTPARTPGASLVERARAVSTVRKRNPVQADVVELALAWAAREVNMGQVMQAMGIRQSQFYVTMARALAQWIRENTERQTK